MDENKIKDILAKYKPANDNKKKEDITITTGNDCAVIIGDNAVIYQGVPKKES